MTLAKSVLGHSTAAPRRNTMIAVASGKGGVGKTWFAITLAQALARRGRRTLLFDGDLGLANVDIQLGLMPAHDLSGVLSGRLAVCDALIPYTDGGFDIIAGRSGCGRLANVPFSRLQQLGHDLAALAASYDHAILDLGAGIERTVRHLSLAVGTCIVITHDEPTALTDAYAFIKLAVTEQPAANIQVVVNMASSFREGERTYATLFRACEGFLKISPPLLGVIRRDPKVRDTIRHQVPLLTRFPTSEAAADVDDIAAKLVGMARAAA